MAIKEKSENMWEEQLSHWHQGQWRKRGRRCSGSRSWDSPAAVVMPMVKPMEDHGEAESCMTEQVDAWEEALNTFCAGASFLAGTVTPWMAHTSAAIPWKTELSGRMTQVGGVCVELLLVGWADIGEVHGELSPMIVIPCWSRGRIPLLGSRRNILWWTDCKPRSLSLCTSGERR